MRALILSLLVFLSGYLHTRAADAHALEPGYLEITLLGANTWRVFWSRPDVQGTPMKIDAVLPTDCDITKGPDPTFNGSAWTVGWVASCSNGMIDGRLQIEGLESTRTDVLVRYELEPSAARSKRLTPDAPGFVIKGDPGPLEVTATYLPFGVQHILSGVDHLLFVFALLLLIGDRWRLLGAITAFTVAHSLTLAAATLNLITLPSPPVEAVIALSIMFLASELLQRRAGRQRLSERYPWSVSFSFGLLHGFGFAGALQEIGLPQGEIPLALLSFNLGVEVGQIAFVIVVFALAWALKRVTPSLIVAFTTPGSKFATGLAYAIGGVSAYWFLDRLTGFI